MKNECNWDSGESKVAWGVDCSLSREWIGRGARAGEEEVGEAEERRVQSVHGSGHGVCSQHGSGG